MCGIAGYIGTKAPNDAAAERCLATMARRGPDGQGMYRHHRGKREVLLLHTRLSIIDLDPRSAQPFREGDDALVFNGELYNYLELKAQLQQDPWRTESDTEVLLRQLRTHGTAGLDACEGMWGFAWYQAATGTLSLCRDRFGEKPLYIHETADGLYFASEVKFIFALLGQRLPVNYDHLYRYMVNGYKSLYKQPISFFKGIREVPTGSVLSVDEAGRETCARYWTYSLTQNADMTFEEAVAGARERLLRSMELRLRADVPLAFCLSGGIDSNTLIAMAKREFGYDVHGFTISNTDARYDEADMVDCAVRELGLRHTSIPLQTRDFLPRLKELVRYHDAPVYTITYYAHWLLMQAVAERGYKVSVSGSAADELFTGYFDHHLLYLAEVAGTPAHYEVSRANWEQHIKPIVRNPFLQNPRAFVDQPNMRDHIYLNADEFRSYLRRPWAEDYAEHPFPTSLLRMRMLNELFHEATPVILHEDDLNAMYYSIENRSPFLDRPLFDFCQTIPTHLLVRDGAAKAVLREAMRGIVPDPILNNRHKVGFNAPILDFLDTKSPEVREWMLDDSPIYEHVRRESIESVMARPTLPNSFSKFVFNFVTAKCFLEEFDA